MKIRIIHSQFFPAQDIPFIMLVVLVGDTDKLNLNFHQQLLCYKVRGPKIKTIKATLYL